MSLLYVASLDFPEFCSVTLTMLPAVCFSGLGDNLTNLFLRYFSSFS